MSGYYVGNNTVVEGGSASGLTFLGALTILFIGLKLSHVIDWGWLLVLAPLWMPIAAVVIIILVVLAVIAVLATGHILFAGGKNILNWLWE